MPNLNYDFYNRACPSRHVLEIISNKWSILIIIILSQKIYRFGELKRKIGGISPKMLAQTLKSLERYGFISKKNYPGLILKVEYALTHLGKELCDLLTPLTDWTIHNMQRIRDAEQKFGADPLN